MPVPALPRPEPRFLHVAAGLNAPPKPLLKRSAQVPRFRYLDATVQIYIVVPNKNAGLPPPTPPRLRLMHPTVLYCNLLVGPALPPPPEIYAMSLGDFAAVLILFSSIQFQFSQRTVLPLCKFRKSTTTGSINTICTCCL